jgi:hypothetical protein
MALVAANVRVGAGKVYIGVTPASAGDAVDLTAGVPGTGTEVGLTEGESVFTYEVTYFEIMAEQSLASVAAFASEESAQIEYTMKEYITANIIDVLGEGLIAQSAPGGDNIFEGGKLASDITLQSVMLVSKVSGTAFYTYAFLYQAYQSESATLRYTKSGDTLMKVTMKGIADITRADTSTLFQLCIETA